MYESLFHHAAQVPDAIGLIDDGGSYSWRMLAGMTLRAREVIGSATDKATAGILLPPGAGFVASFLGTLSARKVAVPINFLLGPREITHIISDSRIDVIISATPLLERFSGLPCRMLDLTTALASDVPHGEAMTSGSDPEATAVILYTSGTSASGPVHVAMLLRRRNRGSSR